MKKVYLVLGGALMMTAAAGMASAKAKKQTVKEPVIANFTEDIHNDDYLVNYISPEYKASDMVCDAGREKESLDGEWNFSTDQYDYCLRGKWYEEKMVDDNGLTLPRDYDFDDWETIKVPGTWNTQKKEYFYYEGPGVYTRTFRYKNNGEKRVLLKFGAAYYHARIFLNKKFVGYHRGGSTPFYVDVTNYLKDDNRIIVVVDNERRRNQLPSINTDWFNYGGIFRSVELIRLPDSYIKDFSIHLAKGSRDKAEGYVTVATAGDGKKAEFAEVAIKGTDVSIKVPLKAKGNGMAQGEFSFRYPFELWTPNTPKLYSVTVKAGNDAISDDIGFRTIETRGQNILLNGEPIYLNGVSCHEDSVLNGRAVTEDEIKENFRLAKEMNCNFMRLAHYPHDEREARLADKMGILLWEEVPVYWLIDFANEGTFSDAKNQLTELITRDKNRASVIIWSVGNENPDTDARLSFMSRLADAAHSLDATRLVSAACLVNQKELRIADRLEKSLDIIGLNEYYGWYDPDFEKLPKLFANSSPQKPVIITEFGADAYPGRNGKTDEKGCEQYQEYVYKKQTALFSRIPYIKGTTPWILFDFRTPRRMSSWQRGYNTKGLLSADKTHKKLAYSVMQQFYKERGTAPKD